MKIQIIRLEEHDDIVSASDKLGWAQTGRVVIVWPVKPKRARRTMAERRTPAVPLTRRLDLVLLQRRAQELGVQIAFVSHQPQVRAYAATLGIPVFNTPREAQTLHWRRVRRRRFAWQRKQIEERRLSFRQELAAEPHRHPLATPATPPLANRVLVFLLSLAAVLALAGALVPGAHIRLAPAVQVQTLSLPVSASAQVAAISLAGEVPTHPLTTIVEGQASITSTAQTLVPDQFASGYVRFTNLTTETITVPLGTIVTTPMSDTIRFATTRASVLPGSPGSSVFITVKATSPGVAANLPPNSIQVIEGNLNFRVGVANIAATRGGTDRMAPSPAPDDRIRVYNQLVEILRQDALIDLQAQLAPGDILLPTTLVLDETLLKSYQPDGALPSDNLTLSLRMQYHAQLISGADLHKLGSTLLDASLPAGYTPLPDTLDVTMDSTPQLDRNQVAHWQITVRRRLLANLSKDQAVHLALGLSPDQAIQRLDAAMPLATPPVITVNPGWWPRLPFIPLRIVVSDEGS